MLTQFAVGIKRKLFRVRKVGQVASGIPPWPAREFFSLSFPLKLDEIIGRICLWPMFALDEDVSNGGRLASGQGGERYTHKLAVPAGWNHIGARWFD